MMGGLVGATCRLVCSDGGLVGARLVCSDGGLVGARLVCSDGGDW